MASKKSNAPKNDFPCPYTTVDVLIFTVIDDALKLLLVQRPSGVDEPSPGLWALPGGFVNVDLDADLEACARRKLHEKHLQRVVVHREDQHVDRGVRTWKVVLRGAGFLAGHVGVLDFRVDGLYCTPLLVALSN